MQNIVFLETYSTELEDKQLSDLKLPLESFITLCIYNCCCPQDVILKFVSVIKPVEKTEIILKTDIEVIILNKEDIPWQVASCLLPVVIFDDTIITGLCAVARHICRYRKLPKCPQEHEEGLLGFRKGCLQAPNEVSVWTKFCEIDIVYTVQHILLNDKFLQESLKNLTRFENHLRKPVKVHNVYKIARDIKKESIKSDKNSEETDNKVTKDTVRASKPRKWKSNLKKKCQITSTTKIEDLEINHQYAEGPFLTLADLILLPSFHIIIESLGNNFKTLLPLTNAWYCNLSKLSELQPVIKTIHSVKFCCIPEHFNFVLPVTDDVSLYKCDPKRYNSKRRAFTKEGDIEEALSLLMVGMLLNISKNETETEINWDDIPSGANPSAGHLPDTRMLRKSQQLENLALSVISIARPGDRIVDFCSGSGHLGILVAHLLPECTVILLENKEQSLLRARKRVHDMELKNVYFFQCNLDFFMGEFDIGVALHACGIASDLVLDKCLKVNAKFVLCPCCYGSLHATDRLVYPRSSMFRVLSIDKYMCIGHAADQTHEEHPLTVRGERCMATIDSDRARLAEEHGYKVTLARLKPLSCTPKNNLLIGVPS